MPFEPAVAAVNVYEGGGQLSVVIPIPGAHPDNVRVTVGPTHLRMHADCKYPQESQHYHRRDWQVGSWRAEVELPRAVDPRASRAMLSLGVLMVSAPIAAAEGDGEHEPAIESPRADQRASR